MLMKKSVAICTLIALCAGQSSVFADKAKEDEKNKTKTPPGLAKKDTAPPGLEKKDGVPPGLEKKDNLPPGIAKKQEQSASTSPTTVAVAPAPKPTEPAPVATKPAEKPVSTPTPTATQPALTEDQKAKLNNAIRSINDASTRPTLKKLALRQIATETGVPFETIEQQEQRHPGIHPASLLLGNLVAKRSGKDFENVIVGRDNEKSWVEIATRHKVPLAPLIQKAQDVAMVVQAANKAAAR
jgi:hypothetical protein